MKILLLGNALFMALFSPAQSARAEPVAGNDFAGFVRTVHYQLERHWTYPESAKDGDRCALELVIESDGSILSMTPSGCASPELAHSVQRAVAKTGNLPPLPEGSVAPMTIKIVFVVGAS